MESKKQFVQQRTVKLSFTDGTATAFINVPFAVDRIRFKFAASNSNTKAWVDLRSDLITWNSVCVLQVDDQIGTTASVDNIYYFQTPTKIQGNYTFEAYTPGGLLSTALNTHSVVLVAEFIRDEM